MSEIMLGECDCCPSGRCSERPALKWAQTWPNGWFLKSNGGLDQHRPFSPPVTLGWNTWATPPGEVGHKEITEAVDGLVLSEGDPQFLFPRSPYQGEIGQGQFDHWAVYAATCFPNLIHFSKSKMPFSRTIPGTHLADDTPAPGVNIYTGVFVPGESVVFEIAVLIAFCTTDKVSVRKADNTFVETPLPCDVALPFTTDAIIGLAPGGFNMIPEGTKWELEFQFT